MDATIYWYTNAGTSKGVLAYDDAVHEEDLDGTDMLTVTTEHLPSKRDKLVWQDGAGNWHEHMVDASQRVHRDSRPRTSVQCSNSIAELYGVRVGGTVATRTVQGHLAAILSGTRWTAGTCDVSGYVRMETWHKDARTSITELCELCGGELETEITVGEDGVIARTARIVRRRGSSAAIRQFSYGCNVTGITREVTADEVYTAVIGYGARLDEESEDDYAPRLTVMAVSQAALTRWGVPLPNGNFAHNFDIYTDTNCTDAQFLLKQCRKVLATECKPLIRYEFEVPEGNDRMWSDVQLGDVVQCVDGGFDPAIELMERVSHISRRLSGRVGCIIAIGKRVNPIVEQFKAAAKYEVVLPIAESPITEGEYPNDEEAVDPETLEEPWPTDVIAETYDPEEYGDYEPEDWESYDFDWGDVGGAYTTDLTPEEISELPDAISITVEPSELEYTEGENLDFSGIEVTLMRDGSTYTSGAYPDGIVPYGELIFPVTVAAADGGVTPDYEYGTVNGGPSEWWPYPTVLSKVVTRTDSWSGRKAVRTWTASGDSVIAVVSNMSRSYSIVFISASQSDTVTYRYVETRGETVYSDSTSTKTLASSYTRNGKTAYYGYDATGFGPNFVASNLNPYVSYSSSTGDRGALAWAAIYGDATVADTTTVPVQWMRSDGTILEDTYEITVSENKFANEADDAYAGSVMFGFDVDFGAGLGGSSVAGGGGGGAGSGGGGAG